MKAWVLKDIGRIEYCDIDIPKLNSDEVLLNVKNCGICGSDIPRIYQNGAHKHPIIPGHEFSGLISDIGLNVSHNMIEKRVAVFPLIPCKKCKQCLSGHYEMCRDYNYLGSRCDGGFAEYVAVPIWNTVEIPDNVSFESAAMLEPMAVAMHAIRRAVNDNTVKESSVVIYGLGPIGVFVLMFLLQMGFSNIAVIGNKEFQYKKVVEIGLHESKYIDYYKGNVNDKISSLFDGYGADIVFECTGRNETISSAVDIAAPGGTVLLMGNPFGNVSFPRNIYWKILRNQLKVIGTWNSSYQSEMQKKEFSDDWHLVLDYLKKQNIYPEKIITHRFSINEIEKGFHIMRDKSEDYLKIMMEN